MPYKSCFTFPFDSKKAALLADNACIKSQTGICLGSISSQKQPFSLPLTTAHGVPVNNCCDLWEMVLHINQFRNNCIIDQLEAGKSLGPLLYNLWVLWPLHILYCVLYCNRNLFWGLSWGFLLLSCYSMFG